MSYRYAHWYFLAALIAIVAGFWPSFFKPLRAGTVAHNRAGERRLAYPLSLAFFVCVHALMSPVAGSAWWGNLMAWYAGLGIFG